VFFSSLPYLTYQYATASELSDVTFSHKPFHIRVYDNYADSSFLDERLQDQDVRPPDSLDNHMLLFPYNVSVTEMDSMTSLLQSEIVRMDLQQKQSSHYLAA
jgi:uncharacterized small protein (DUF1192 family)